MIEYIKLPVETVDNDVIALEEKQIAYQSAMLDMQMGQMAAQAMAPQLPQVTQGNTESIEAMQSQPVKRATAISNPRPNTLSVMEGEKNII